ncbi:MAG: glycosyltransferase family 9 protein [Pyrinomonadaceae bacterium]
MSAVFYEMAAADTPQNQISDPTINWSAVKRVLVVKLRSIGDTVLATPSLIVLRRFLPDAQIDILLEDWVAPLLDGFEAVDNVIPVCSAATDRLRVAWQISRNGYDAAFNLHGGTTATFFTAASRAKHRVGFASYQYSFLYNHLLSSSADFWQRRITHSAEQQLALLGFVGVPVDDQPTTRLAVSEAGRTARVRIRASLAPYALIHPSTAFATKQWPTENFAQAVEHLAARGIESVAIASPSETAVLDELNRKSSVAITTFDDLTLPEITALASQAKIFIGNDSGIAHIAAAVGTPTVVIFGSSNRNHWRPWTDAPNEIVFNEFACQPCAGYECKVFGEPRCILTVTPESVFAAINKVLANTPARHSGIPRRS